MLPPSRRLLVILAGFVISFLALGSSAGADFQSEQTALFRESSRDVAQMSQGIDDILDVYIEASDDVYWNDPEIVLAFQSYLQGFDQFGQRLQEVWALSSRAYKERLATFRLQLQKSKRRGATKSCIRKARGKRGRGVRLFRSMNLAFNRALEKQSVLGLQNDNYSALIFPAEAAELVDPEPVESWINHLYDYSSSTNGVYMSGFYAVLSSSIKSLKKCK